MPTGVLRKIISQVTAWKERGHEVRLYSLVPPQPRPAALEYDGHGEIFGTIPQLNLDRIHWAHLGYLNKVLTAPRIARRLREDKPHILYYRQQGPWYPGLMSILSTAPCVMEINANLSEASHWGLLQRLYTEATRGRVLSSASALVCVSRAIAAEFARFGKPVHVVPNSMWENPDPLPPTGNAKPVFIFVGSVLAGGKSWHGVDKLFLLAAALPDCIFHIVGLSKSDYPGQTVPYNIRFHGPLYGKDLLNIYRKSDVGIGALALHRRGIDENSALKPLEYLMHGLPVILGYRETEPALNFASYTLHIENHEGNVAENVEAIRRFADAWCNRRVTEDLTYLSRDVIETRRLEVFGFYAGRVAKGQTYGPGNEG